MRHIVITACDASHFDLAEDLITSIRQTSSKKYTIGFIRLCATPLPASIASQVDVIVDDAQEAASFDKTLGYYAAYRATKARLPTLFPGFDLYTWIDADCWLQNDITLRKVEVAAQSADLCAHPMLDVHYMNYPMPSDRTLGIYAKAAPPGFDQKLLRMPMINAGVISALAQSPIWARWHENLKGLRARHEAGHQVFFSDEVPMNYVLRTQPISVFPLRSQDNWQTYACAPNLDLQTRRVVAPTFPFEALNIIHLAGTTKDELYNVGLPNKIRLRYREVNAAFASLARK